jgi:hypothetical protein
MKSDDGILKYSYFPSEFGWGGEIGLKAGLGEVRIGVDRCVQLLGLLS